MVGRFVPSLTLSGADPRSLLIDGKAVLLDLVDSSEIRSVADGHTDRVQVVSARCSSHVDLAALLIRPDGYIARATSQNAVTGLSEALTHWFGAASVSSGA